MRAGQARSVYKALSDYVIGRATLANVECLFKETAGVLQGLAMGRTDAVAPMMALAQSLELLFVEFHVHLVLARVALRLLVLLYTVASGTDSGARDGASKRLCLHLATPRKMNQSQLHM